MNCLHITTILNDLISTGPLFLSVNGVNACQYIIYGGPVFVSSPPADAAPSRIGVSVLVVSIGSCLVASFQ